jgi:hypothetical protein
VAGFPRAWLRLPIALEILDASRAGLVCAENDRPSLPIDDRRRLAPNVAVRAARIREARDRIARELAFDPSILASRSVVEEIARRFEAGEDPWDVPELRRWQSELLRPEVT